MKKLIYFSAAVLATACLSACDQNKGGSTPEEINPQDAAFQTITENFVNKTVIPTYHSLSTATEELVELLQTAKEQKTDAALQAACDKFLEARAYWEKSEAFLFGPATTWGIDPHIDSWPLDVNKLQAELSNADKVLSLQGDDADLNAGDLASTVLGFHGIEWVLFRDGEERTYLDEPENTDINAPGVTDFMLTYAIAVAGDLRNNCWRMELGWAGEDNVDQKLVDKIIEMDVEYTYRNYSYGETMVNAGLAGSIYASKTEAVEAIIDGCKTICDEVGTQKIGKAHTGEDISYIESPYSYKSIQDFKDNIISVENVYYGGLDAESLGTSSDQYDMTNSLYGFLHANYPEVEAALTAAIGEAVSKIEAMKFPFVLNYTDPSAQEAMDACAALTDALTEAQEAIRGEL